MSQIYRGIDVCWKKSKYAPFVSKYHEIFKLTRQMVCKHCGAMQFMPSMSAYQCRSAAKYITNLRV